PRILRHQAAAMPGQRAQSRGREPKLFAADVIFWMAPCVLSSTISIRRRNNRPTDIYAQLGRNADWSIRMILGAAEVCGRERSALATALKDGERARRSPLRWRAEW